jgi:hypothetical protein
MTEVEGAAEAGLELARESSGSQVYWADSA